MNGYASIHHDAISSITFRQPVRGAFGFIAVIAAVLCLARPARADSFVWTGAPSIFGSWNTQNNWTNVTPGGVDPDGIPDGDDTASFNTNAITSGGEALNLSIANTATLTIASSSVAVNGGTVNNQHLLTFAGLGNYDQLGIRGSVSLQGGGELLLVNNNSHIDDFGSGTITNVDNLIHGGGGATVSVPIVNQAVIRADNGTLNILAPIDNNATNARVEVGNGARLDLGNAQLNGLVVVTPGGLINGILANVTNPGTLTAPGNGTPLTLRNTLTNQGRVTFEGLGNYDQLGISGSVSLQGGGELFLVNNNSHIDDFGSGTITNVDNLIHGGGGATVSVPIVNQAVIRADNGTLNIPAPIDNNATNARVEVGNNTRLDLGNAQLNGLVVVTPGGLINGILANVTNPGTLTAPGSGTPLTLRNTLTNQGRVTFEGLGNYDQLGISGSVSLQGGGELLLLNNNSHIDDFGSGTITNVDNLIHGGGGATVSVPIFNQAVIRADNGILNILAPIDNNATNARVEVGNGARLDLGNAQLNGLVVVTPGGLINGILANVTNPGTLTAPGNGTPLTLRNTLTNQGRVTFEGLGNYDQLGISGSVSLQGGGELLLLNNNSHIDDFGSGTITNVDNLIHGGGGATVSVPIVNQAVIRADNGTLNILAPIDNSSGTLQVQAAGLSAGEFTLLHFGGNATLGGTLEVTFLNGFLPHVGDVLKPIQLDGTVSGDFAQITFRGIGPGFQVQGQVVGGFYQLTALNSATPAPLIISPLSATATLGRPFIYQIVSSPHATTYGASPLPSGLSLNPSTGIISGVPTQTGTSQVLLSATGNGTGTATLVLTTQPPPSSGPVIGNGTAVTGRVARPFSFQVFTTGGTPSARVSASGLPPGLSISAVTGLISGTPTAEGSFAVTLTVTDGTFTTNSTLQLTFTADPAVPVIISPGSATLVVGQFFSYTISAPSSADPSSDPTIFTYIGTLPPGLTFDAATGTISGFPTGPLGPELAGGAVLGSIQLFATNSHGTSTFQLLFRAPPSGAVNIATRLQVGTGGNVLIGGFIITGNAPKIVIIRAIGPSLNPFLSGALQDPTLELHDSANNVVFNDNWKDTQEQFVRDTGIPPADDREAAIVIGLDPGSYTAIVAGKNGTTGIALVEVYDLGTASLDTSANARLANIATRGFVDTGNNVMIGGFQIRSQATRVVVRAIGPSLNPFLSGALQDPTLELKDSNGATLISNDDWQVGRPPEEIQEIQQLGLAPTDPHESALITTPALAPGGYTAIVSGKNSTTGVALVEVYALQ